MTDNQTSPPTRLSEDQAKTLAEEAVERLGGTRMIYRNPRHPFSLQPTNSFTIESHVVEVRWGEISSPAIVSVAGYVFEIHETELELLVRPPRPRIAE